jgi:hypothetical protein
LRSKWAAGPAAAGRDEGAYLNRYVTEEQRSRRPIFIATLWAARLLAGCFVLASQLGSPSAMPLTYKSDGLLRLDLFV